jgi:flagellar basal-body rod protein FlgG
MMRALNTAGTGMVSQQMNLDTIANNLANVNTTAFKQQRAQFQDLVYQTFRASGASAGGTGATPQASQIGLGSRFASSSTSFALGVFQPSGDPMHMAINGDGFFQVTLPDGTAAYTRDGTFAIDSAGQVVTADGYLMEPGLTVPTGATQISISQTGVVSAKLPGQDEVSEIGNIQLVVFPNPAGLTRMGQNLYQASAGSGTAAQASPGSDGAGTVNQYFIEGSNVQIVEEMVNMITAQRAYEINSKAIQTADDMLGILNSLKR